MPEVEGCGGALDAQEFFLALGAEGILRGFPQTIERGGGLLHGGAHEHGALVAYFSTHKATRQLQAAQGIAGGAELLDARHDVFQGMTAQQGAEPSAGGEVGDGYLQVAQKINGLGADLHVSEEGHVGEVGGPHFIQHMIFVFHHQDSGIAPHPGCLGVLR